MTFYLITLTLGEVLPDQGLALAVVFQVWKEIPIQAAAYLCHSCFHTRLEKPPAKEFSSMNSHPKKRMIW